MNDELKVLNAKNVGFTYPNSVYVGRPSDFGNPFSIGIHGNRSQVIQRFKTLVENNKEFKQQIKDILKGKNLICWCSPLPCHADILLQIANSED